MLIKDFMIKLFSVPLFWRIWLILLMILNMLMPLLFIQSAVAQWTLIAFFIAFITGLIIYKNTGFTKLLGLMHWPWIVLLIYLGGHLGATQPNNLFGIWLRLVIACNGLSLILDTVDIIKYSAGDRQPISE